MAFHWRAYNGPKLNAGLVALWFFRGSGPVFLRKNLYFCYFSGVGGLDPLYPSGFAHVFKIISGVQFLYIALFGVH